MSLSSRKKTKISKVFHQSHWRESLQAAMQPVVENSGESEINVGKRLQEMRILRGLSIRSLAEMSGLNFNTLSLIENEKSSPNVNTLQQLATALNVSITSFFEAGGITREVVFQKNHTRPSTLFPHGKLEDLGGGLALGEATPLLMTAKQKTTSGKETIAHSGQEFIYCLEGNLVYFVGDKEYVLSQGDSLIFQAHIPHRWENKSNSTTRCIFIICPSDNEDRFVGQHLEKKLT